MRDLQDHPGDRRLYRRSLPMFPGLRADQQERVVSEVMNFVAASKV
jgi:hypothetical protein